MLVLPCRMFYVMESRAVYVCLDGRKLQHPLGRGLVFELLYEVLKWKDESLIEERYVMD